MDPVYDRLCAARARWLALRAMMSAGGECRRWQLDRVVEPTFGLVATSPAGRPIRGIAVVKSSDVAPWEG